MTRRAIQQLPPDLVNRIAAGEVIERPASVVKELVENALDAGATRITIEIEAGGKRLIRVIDDGGGIPVDELPLAFAQHATSKVGSDEELASVATMGFRGEALASIGSVSRARILSRCGDATAHELQNDGGALGRVVAAAGNAGTSVEVRDLFFNTPARRKFLKNDAAESGQITEMLIRLALPRPEVHFRYLRDGKCVADWPATDAVDRLLVAWPREYAEAFRERPMRLDVTEEREEGTWRLEGILGLPEFAATTGRYQQVYVNGRGVRDRGASHALREAYRGLTEPGRHPAAILLLTAPPGEVDVNVHPTKAEVRFRNAGHIWSLIHTGVREVLLAHDLAPRAQLNATPPPWASAPREDVRSSLASFFKDALGHAQQTLELTAPAPLSGGGPAVLPEAAERARAADASSGVQPSASPADHFAREPELRGEAGDDSQSAASQSMIRPEAFLAPPAADARAIQLHNSYLVVQSPEGMEIIDQHALHERILYEELLARVQRGALESQRMLIPVTFEAPESQVALLEDLAPALQRLGIEAEPFGPELVAVQAFPSFLSRLDPAAFVRELLEKAEADAHQPGRAAGDEGLVHEVLDLMACKAAVKAGDPLTPAEIEALIARRHDVARSSNCPHGRPTTLRLSLGDLERQFKRTGF